MIFWSSNNFVPFQIFRSHIPSFLLAFSSFNFNSKSWTNSLTYGVIVNSIVPAYGFSFWVKNFPLLWLDSFLQKFFKIDLSNEADTNRAFSTKIRKSIFFSYLSNLFFC